MADEYEQAGEPVSQRGGDEPPEWPRDLASQLERSRSTKLRWVREWEYCNNFLRLIHDQVGGVASSIASSSYSSRRGRRRGMIVPMCLTVYRHVVARMRMAVPGMTVAPATAEIDDILKAQSTELVMRHWWRSMRVHELLEDAILPFVDWGSCALHWFWDPELDWPRWEVFEPHDVFFADGVLTPKDSPWIALRRLLHPEEVWELYPDKAQRILGSAGSDRGMDVYPTSTRDHGEPPERAEMFDVYWTDGSKRYARICGNYYLEKGVQATAKPPVSFARYTPIPRVLWGMGLIYPLIELNAAYDSSREQVRRAVELTANPMMAYERASGIPSTSRKNRTGQWIGYSGVPPHYLNPPAMPAFLGEHLGRLQAELYDTANIHPSSAGKQAMGVMSGRAISELEDNDTKPLADAMGRFGRMVRDAAEGTFELMQLYWTEDRMVQAFDSAGPEVALMITETDIAPEGAEVYVDIDSLWVENEVKRRRQIIEDIQLGIRDPMEARELLDTKGPSTERHRKYLGRMTAKRMLEAAIANQELPPEQRRTPEGWIQVELFDFDDLDAILEVFQEFVRDDDKMDELDPDVQEYVVGVMKVAHTMKTIPPEVRLQMVEPGAVPVRGDAGGGLPSQPRPPMTAAPTGPKPGPNPQPPKSPPQNGPTSAGEAMQQSTTMAVQANPGGGML